MDARTPLTWLVLVASCATAFAQTPVFSPPKEPLPQPAGERPAAEQEEKQEQPAAAASQDVTGTLLERLREWPAREARQAALVLAGLGSSVRDRLIQGLQDNDWRIQAGCANALAEMRAKEALEPLRKAIALKSNRASLPVLMAAITKIDPEGGPEVVIPFLGHTSARVRVAAREALPEELSEKYLPEVLEYLMSPRTFVRAAALDLLGRMPGQGERDEWYAALSDPEPQVAYPAAVHLARLGTPKVRARLLDLARTAPMRLANYAMIALTMLEDLHQEEVVPDRGAIRQRAQQFLRSEDPFYAGSAAILLANVSYRSEDPILRELADKYLMPIILGTVAGGVFFSDYTSLEGLCWQKLALLSGANHGQDAMAWREWWARHREGFVARRELRSVTPDELAKSRLRMVRIGPDGSVLQVWVSGLQSDLLDPGGSTPFVLSGDQLERLADLLSAAGFFETRGDLPDPQRLDGSLELELRVPGSGLTFARQHYGPVPERLRPLCAWLEEARRELAWQQLVPPGADRMAFVKEQQAYFASAPDPERRQERLLSLAVAAYSGLSRSGRALAVSVIQEAPSAWVSSHQEALAGLLRHEQHLTEEAAELVALLGAPGDEQVRDAVLDVVSSTASQRSDEVLRRFLEKQPLPGIMGLMRDARPRIRAVAAESLCRFDGDPEVVSLLIKGLEDYEPRVQDACLKTLATMKDERIMAMLEAVLAGDEPQLRMRAIEALGMVGHSQAVPRLMELYRDGDRHTRWAVVRGLRRAGGLRAIVALAGIVRESGELEIRKEALESMVRLGGTGVAERIEEIIGRTRDLDIRVMAIGSLAEVMGARAVRVIEPLLEDPELQVRRMALLTMARLGETSAVEGLLESMSRPEGDMAAEHAFQDLTFNVCEDPSPPRRYQAYRAWQQSHGKESRLEWFLHEAAAATPGLDPSVDWLQAERLTGLQVRALIPVLEKGNRPLREAADATLRRATSLGLEPVGPVPEEATDRAQLYKLWLADHPR